MNIQRYSVVETALCIGGKVLDGEVAMVRASEHDAELAALREELAEVKSQSAEYGRSFNAQCRKTDSLNKSLTAAEQRNAELRQEIAVLHSVKETPGENVLWDVLNATVGIITRRAYPHALESEAHNAGAKVILDRRAGLTATHLKPAESGASE